MHVPAVAALWAAWKLPCLAVTARELSRSHPPLCRAGVQGGPGLVVPKGWGHAIHLHGCLERVLSSLREGPNQHSASALGGQSPRKEEGARGTQPGSNRCDCGSRFLSATWTASGSSGRAPRWPRSPKGSSWLKCNVPAARFRRACLPRTSNYRPAYDALKCITLLALRRRAPIAVHGTRWHAAWSLLQRSHL